MQLKQDSTLKEGKYKIEKVLGQGGFGITYLSEQDVTIQGGIGAINTKIKVTIKEFFIPDLCNRDSNNSHVSVSSPSGKEMAEKFKRKFIKEAKAIAKLNHDHIIKVLDVFEENDTAYYVMEYIDGGSLNEYVARCGTLSESEALHHIYQIAEALRYIHSQRMNHLDVKPSNILLKAGAHSILIDFGLAKQYDQAGIEISSTPVGVSKGYAPIEQYKAGSVSSFSPATDIYSLGATLYKLVTGDTPPEAYEVFENGLPELPQGLSQRVKQAIIAAMQPSRAARPQSIEEFLDILKEDKQENEAETTILPELNDESETILIAPEPKKDTPKSEAKREIDIDQTSSSTRKSKGKGKGGLVAIILALALIITGAVVLFWNPKPITSQQQTPFTKECYQALGSPSELTIPDTYTSITNGIFQLQRGLTSVVIPSSVSQIGDRAFSACYDLRSIVIPNSVELLDEELFSHCEKLTSITLPESLKRIGVGAFFYCRSLRSIVIPESVTQIDAFAFAYCDALHSITIPVNVSHIGESAFSNCGNITIYVSEQSPVYQELKQEYGAMVKAQ